MYPTQWLCLFLLGALAGCTIAPTQQADNFAEQAGFSQSTVTGSHFKHRVYSRIPGAAPSILHVYIDGDGSPWVSGSKVAIDPTPRTPLALYLMAQDRAATLYLGRPCYFGLAQQSPCTPADWTHGRYAEPVIDSMVSALSQLLATTDDPDIVFIGYSGGGNIAMLLAPQFTQTRAVITITPNLDHTAWTNLHHYSPLHSSLSAATAPPLRPHIVQLHLAGQNDANIPPSLIRSALGNQAATLRVIPGFDHSCCWQQLWPEILEELAQLVIDGN